MSVFGDAAKQAAASLAVEDDTPDELLASCGGCSARWTGEDICHCATCHLTFTSVGPFDAHRDHSTADGRCRTEDELCTRGLEPNESGYWRKPRPADSLPERK